MDIREVLDEREKTHGSFAVHSAVTQNLKSCLRVSGRYTRLTQMQREAVEMICHKIGRIMAGDPNHTDHWQDIAGYATLIVGNLEKP